MKNQTLIILFVLALFTGCEEEVPSPREFPIITTLSASNVDATGATFQGKLIQRGTTPTSGYGFVWGVNEPNIDQNIVIIGENLNSKTFQVRIDSALIKGIEYQIRAFAVFGNKIVYGNTIELKSKGSTKDPFAIEATGYKLYGNGNPTGSVDNESGFVMFPSSFAYIFDDVTYEFKRINNIPVVASSNIQIASTNISNAQYIFVDSNLYLLRNGNWSIQSKIPFTYNSYSGYYHTTSISDNIYILSPNKSYMYSIANNTWKSKMPLPGTLTIGGTNFNNKAYILTSDKKIWEYNPANDTWVIKTLFPGVIRQRVIAFAFNNKIYFGLSYSPYSSNTERILWSYNLNQDKWKIEVELPLEVPYLPTFSFFLKNKLYIGTYDIHMKQYDLITLDPSK